MADAAPPRPVRQHRDGVVCRNAQVRSDVVEPTSLSVAGPSDQSPNAVVTAQDFDRAPAADRIGAATTHARRTPRSLVDPGCLARRIPQDAVAQLGDDHVGFGVG